MSSKVCLKIIIEYVYILSYFILYSYTIKFLQLVESLIGYSLQTVKDSSKNKWN